MSIFNKVHDRRGSASVKWDMMNVVYNLKDNTTELLPMWVADMDFPPPAALTEALKARLEHPIFGYTFADNDVKMQLFIGIKRATNGRLILTQLFSSLVLCRQSRPLSKPLQRLVIKSVCPLQHTHHLPMYRLLRNVKS